MWIGWLAGGVAAIWGLRQLAHQAILRGLRAPRLAHALTAADWPVAAQHVREVRIEGPNAKPLFGWLVSPAGAPGSAAGHAAAPAVVALHGWGANAAMMWPVVPPLHAAGFAVLLIDARCHGRSGDDDFTSMPRFAEDLSAALAWLRRQPGIDGGRVALLGHSVGAAACLLHAAQQHDVCAVLSLSAFAHPQEMMRSFLAEKRVPYPVLGWYVMRHVQRVIGNSFERIAPLATLARVSCPVLLVHGLADTTVPFADAERLLAVAPQRVQLLPVAGDHDLRHALQPHAAVLVNFLRSACCAAGAST